MRDIKHLISEIIPPQDYQHRNGFGNEQIIDSLSQVEKNEVEKELLKLLKNSSDMLIVDTLAYLKSDNALPLLKIKLSSTTSPTNKIYLARAIYGINTKEVEMKDIAFEAFQKITNEYQLIDVFYALSYFQDKRLNDLIQSFQNDKRYLVAYNARQVLGIDTQELIQRERNKRSQAKPWWKIR